MKIFAALLLAAVLQAQPGAPEVHLVGAARMDGTRLRLTSAVPWVAGAAWLPDKKPVAGGFEFTFRFQITAGGGAGDGADGFAFVLQNAGPDAVAGRGAAGGFALGDGYGDPSKPGIPRSIAVFFDTFRNREAGDPSDNYVAISTNGPLRDMKWPPNRLGLSRKLKVHLKDGRVHSAIIRFEPPVMSVSIDGGEPVVRVPVDLTTVIDPSGFAWAGMTASTGSGFENHDILEWRFTPFEAPFVDSEVRYLFSNCMEGRNLCTPEKAVVEERGQGEYHVLLPAQLAWGASVPNQTGAAVEISNARGTVCLALTSSDVADCGGPEGMDRGSPPNLVAPDRKPGALVMKTEDGRTYFSVNDRAKGGFTPNQGYFEFDARVAGR